MNEREDTLLRILKQQVVPALGCTEPIAVALSTAMARKFITGNIEKILVTVDKNIFKNGARVTIPGTNEKGLYIAAALGAIGGNPDRNMEVLQEISQDDVNLAKKYIQQNKVKVELDETKNMLYIHSKIITSDGYAICIIEEEHTNIVYIEVNGKIIKDKGSNQKVAHSSKQGAFSEIQTYSLKDFREFADNVQLQEVAFVGDAIGMNLQLAEKGLKNPDNWGFKLRELLLNRGIDPDKSFMHYPIVLAMSAVYERMNGTKKPAMALAGSGNQGITAVLPLIAIKRTENINDEKLIRSIILTFLITVYGKSYTGLLSPICGSGSIASSAVSGGIVYMLGGSLQQIENALQNTVASTAGMICDGAKTGCALKVATGVSAAINNALLALSGVVVPDKDGIVSGSIEETFQNLGYLVKNGMSKVDKNIVDILSNSKSGSICKK
jgi:L-cysteine desulfidase